MEKIRVTTSTLKSLVEEGKTKVELAEIFGMSVGQITKMLDKAGLKCKRNTDKFILIDDTAAEVEEVEVEEEGPATT